MIDYQFSISTCDISDQRKCVQTCVRVYSVPLHTLSWEGGVVTVETSGTFQYLVHIVKIVQSIDKDDLLILVYKIKWSEC